MRIYGKSDQGLVGPGSGGRHHLRLDQALEERRRGARRRDLSLERQHGGDGEIETHCLAKFLGSRLDVEQLIFFRIQGKVAGAIAQL